MDNKDDKWDNNGEDGGEDENPALGSDGAPLPSPITQRLRYRH